MAFIDREIKHTMEEKCHSVRVLREGKDKEEVFEILCGQSLKPEPAEEVTPDIQDNVAEKDSRACGKVRVAERGLRKAYIPIRWQTGRRRRRCFVAVYDRRKQLPQGP